VLKFQALLEEAQGQGKLNEVSDYEREVHRSVRQVLGRAKELENLGKSHSKASS